MSFAALSSKVMALPGLSTVRKIVAKLPLAKIQELKGDIFGQLPILNVRTGARQLRKPNTGYFVARYHLEFIDRAARLVRFVSLRFNGIFTPAAVGCSNKESDGLID
jgi:hypothetical protein